MSRRLKDPLRELSAEEKAQLQKLSRSGSEPAEHRRGFGGVGHHADHGFGVAHRVLRVGDGLSRVIGHALCERYDERFAMGQPNGSLYYRFEEWAATKQRRAEARASLACEGMDRTAEDEALFDVFEQRRYAHETCRQLIVEYLRPS